MELTYQDLFSYLREVKGYYPLLPFRKKKDRLPPDTIIKTVVIVKGFFMLFGSVVFVNETERFYHGHPLSVFYNMIELDYLPTYRWVAVNKAKDLPGFARECFNSGRRKYVLQEGRWYTASKDWEPQAPVEGLVHFFWKWKPYPSLFQ